MSGEEKGQVRSILAPSVAARHRLRQEPSDLSEGEDEHGQVQSILAPSVAPRHRPRPESSDRNEGEERGQVQSILAPSVAARHRSTQQPDDLGEEHGQARSILAPSAAARYMPGHELLEVYGGCEGEGSGAAGRCPRQRPGGCVGGEGRAQARAMLTPSILAQAAQRGPRLPPSPPTLAARRLERLREGVHPPPSSRGWIEPLPTTVTSL